MASSKNKRMGSSALLLILFALLLWAAHTLWVGHTMKLIPIEGDDAGDGVLGSAPAHGEAIDRLGKKSSKNSLPKKSSIPNKPSKRPTNKKGGGQAAQVVSSHLAVTTPGTSNGKTEDVQRRAYYEKADGETFAPVAYLIIISNEDFLDGALVLGVSLKMNCPRIAAGTADLAIIITQGRVSAASQERLRSEAGFNKIFEVPSLATRAPGAFWKDTFDKIYMFNLTMYKKIVFMDADMINIRSMDVLFDKNYGDATYVGAIGFRGGAEGPYFQTGMMVIQPTRLMFDKIYARFESGVPPQGNNYNHGMNGRDGVLLRDVFGDRFKMIDNKYSRNLNPRWPVPDYVVSLHLRGKIKPWFDRKLPNLDPELGKKEFGHPYVLFWEIYEEQIHKRSQEYQLALRGKPLPEPFGGSHAAADVTPLTHVWMMRYSKKEYVQLLSAEDKKRRNQTVPGLQYFTGSLNASCVDVCGAKSMQCHHKALSFSHGQDCKVLLSAFPDCARCEPGVYWRPHPGSDYPGLDAGKKESVCKYNLLHDERGRPNCTARYETARRFCPCVPLNSCPGVSCDAG
jgi:hypothetical protein